MVTKTENLPIIGLFISIFIAIIMGFIIGALIENLAFQDVNSHVKKILEEERESLSHLNLGMFEDIYGELNKQDPLIVGLNIIDPTGIILYSDELSLIGTTFSGKGKIPKVIKNKDYYTIDRNLISQETILKEAYRHLLILFYNFEGQEFIIQVLYDIRATEKGVLQITSLLWFTILLSVGVLFILLVYISNLTRRTLQKTKEHLELEVKKRTSDLEELSTSLDMEVKKRTRDLESANIKLIQKAAFMTNNPAPVIRMNYSGDILEFNPSAKNLFKKDLRGVKINKILSKLNITAVNNIKTNRIYIFEQTIGEKTILFTIKKT